MFSRCRAIAPWGNNAGAGRSSPGLLTARLCPPGCRIPRGAGTGALPSPGTGPFGAKGLGGRTAAPAAPCQRVCGNGWGSAAGRDVAALCLWPGTENGFFPLFRIKLAGSKPLAKPALFQLLPQAREWVLEGIWSPSIHGGAQILAKCFSPVVSIKLLPVCACCSISLSGMRVLRLALRCWELAAVFAVPIGMQAPLSAPHVQRRCRVHSVLPLVPALASFWGHASILVCHS